MIESDTKVLEDPAANAPTRMIAYLRLNSLLDEFPNVPAHAAAAKAIRQVRSDKQVGAELAAWGTLQDYLHALKRIQPKKVPEMQMQWLPMINAKYAGTYAAEIATMIKHASRLDQ
jgi:REP element-mobilizing transposase RayT